MTDAPNPFSTDTDRRDIWTMLVQRDIDAFVASDWSMVDGDFIHDGFLGIDAAASHNPDKWRIGFPTLAAYRDAWLGQAAESAAIAYAEDRGAAIRRATNLDDIDVKGDVAIAHKKFDGTIARVDGTKDVLNWQTLYYCRKINGVWKLTGFTGYMPYPMGSADAG